ncbi:conjugation TrbI-like protein [Flexibacter flexilis DSM 6793]|uniref:Conjugation TrbI-like protein n=1 Tax=Flexibacter flexilis DSM 6793 TaxID=927664 RepID=A0A1I1MIE9_9BACT|nr:hypothetical protein [Flexibacter flexilis]SFC82453.1 conjugation TrbI-like protein [Flexibacter flexilis DSM 6793]
MKNLKFVFFALLLEILTLNTQAQKLLPTGTIIPVRLVTEAVSNTRDTVLAVVDSDVIVDDSLVIIKGGTPVQVTTLRRKAGIWGRPGKLMLSFINTRSVDNQIIPLTGSYMRTGQNDYANACGISALLCAVTGIGVVYGFFVKGEEVELQRNYVFYNQAFTVGELPIKAQKMNNK